MSLKKNGGDWRGGSGAVRGGVARRRR